MSKKYVFSYFDERNDDFANTKINTIVTPVDFKYYNSNLLYRFFKRIVYLFAALISRICLFFLGVKIKNKKVLKSVKKHEGYFIYGNHTAFFEDAVTGQIAAFPKNSSVICNSDAISIKGIRNLVIMCGAFPIPYYKLSYKNYLSAIQKKLQKGEVFVVYPEAHIWPHYNKIREFGNACFYYPAKFKVASFSKTTVYKKNRFGKFKMYVYFDGPFYPDNSLCFNEAKQKLCNQIKNTMQERIERHKSEENPKYIYIKTNKKDNVGIKQYK